MKESTSLSYFTLAVVKISEHLNTGYETSSTSNYNICGILGSLYTPKAMNYITRFVLDEEFAF